MILKMSKGLKINISSERITVNVDILLEGEYREHPLWGIFQLAFVDELPINSLPLPEALQLDFNSQSLICHALGLCWPVLGENLGKLPFPFHFPLNHDSWCFYGGSFDPWHEGHQECIEQCPEKKLIVFPDLGPHKKNTGQAPLKLCFELLEHLGENHFLYPGFLGTGRRNPTSCWISSLQEKSPSFLLGEDHFLSLSSWKNPDLFLESLATLYVLPRGGQITKKDIQKMSEKHQNLRIKILKRHEFEELSSTELRLKGPKRARNTRGES